MRHCDWTSCTTACHQERCVIHCRKEEIFSEASKALKQQRPADEADTSDGVSDAKKLKTENMPSFTDMMAYIEKKVDVTSHY